jgi:hypothetical protein
MHEQLSHHQNQQRISQENQTLSQRLHKSQESALAFESELKTQKDKFSEELQLYKKKIMLLEEGNC